MYEAVIGLEVHAQLCTRTKAFCACPIPNALDARLDAVPNEAVCPVCLGLPGALPVFNLEALGLAVCAALALGCEVDRYTHFERKNYFYPDSPKGYQISQGALALGKNGACVLPDSERTIRIERVHMEEDAGKSTHHATYSCVDLNRAGVPLVEIVSEPDLRTPKEASEYLRIVRETLMAAGVSAADMEKGNFRCDANISIRRVGTEALGTRVEIKNINSFRFVERALAYEIARQQEAVSLGAEILRETRGFDEATGVTFTMREKEDGADYRYFPDPDLGVMHIDDALLAWAKARIPQLPQAKRLHFQTNLGLSREVASQLTQHPVVSRFFEASAAASCAPTRAGNFIATEVLRDVVFDGLEALFPISVAQAADLVAMQESGALTGPQGKALYQAIKGTPGTPSEVAEALGFKPLDAGLLDKVIAEVVQSHPSQAHAYRAGKEALLGFFVGQVMKRVSANPSQVQAGLLLALRRDPNE